MTQFKLSHDEWLGHDKQIHFLVCFAIALITGFLTALLGLEDTNQGAAIGFIFAIVVGLAKEGKDAVTAAGSGFSYKDLVADLGGAAVGALLFWILFL